MDPNAIFFAVLAQVALTLCVYVALARAKRAALRAGEVDEARRSLFADAWPDRVIQVNNNLRNQFEAPVLFYVLALMLWLLDAAGTAAGVFAWLFVLSRLVHALIHTRSNFVPARRAAFTFGWVMLVALTVIAFVTLIGS